MQRKKMFEDEATALKHKAVLSAVLKALVITFWVESAVLLAVVTLIPVRVCP